MFFHAGFSLLLYPFVANEWNNYRQKRLISDFDQVVAERELAGEIDYLAEHKMKVAANRKLRNYMFNYLEIITVISSILLIRDGTEEALEKKQELWQYIKQKDMGMYMRLRYGVLGNSMNLPGKGGRKISVEGYKICQRFYKFN